MTTHSENLTGVQKELWYLINDEGVRNTLELIIQKMEAIGDGSERLKQLYEEARAYIPSDTKYDEKYWVAAYILHTNKSNLQDLLGESNDINSAIKPDRSIQEKAEEIECKEVDEVLKKEEQEKEEYGQYYDVIGPKPGYDLMLDVLNEIIKKTDYKQERFKKLYYEMDELLDSSWDDESDLEEIDLVAMRIIELEKSILGNIEDELHKIQCELHSLEYEDLPYAEIEMYELDDLDDEEKVEFDESEVIKIERRIRELKDRKKYLLKMFCNIAKRLVVKYLVAEE